VEKPLRAQTYFCNPRSATSHYVGARSALRSRSIVFCNARSPLGPLNRIFTKTFCPRTPPLNFSGVQKLQNFGSTPVAFDALYFQNGGICQKSNTSTLSDYVNLIVLTQTLRSPSPSFYRGGLNISKFGLILDSEAL